MTARGGINLRILLTNSFVATLTSVIIFLLVKIGGGNDLVTTCQGSLYLRGSNPDATETAIISLKARNFLFFTVIQIILGLLAMKHFLHAKDRSVSFLMWATLFVLYIPGYTLMTFLKSISWDYACNEKPNGISGHAFYVAWAMLSIYYLVGSNKRLPAFNYFGVRWLDRMEDWVQPVSTTILSMGLYFTYIYGYHSPQQMFLGGLLGIFWGLVSISFSEYIRDQDQFNDDMAHIFGQLERNTLGDEEEEEEATQN
eukprot:TRINITY_DN1026_c0_g1_i1.p1 TRINITY_DN1026_c0_g1~~TRINITY_DN1026_c0_g1_i1.p1  ORF type:complete len:256 (-),score=51.97 TRINITY_DN1026_c0_g1_i1:590-1357(-)